MLACSIARCTACFIFFISLYPVAVRGNPLVDNGGAALIKNKMFGSVETIGCAALSPRAAIVSPKTEQVLTSTRVAGDDVKDAATEPMMGEVKQDLSLSIEKPLGIITSNREKFFNISRLQARVTPDGRWSLLQGTFVRFPYQLFIAESLEFTKRFRGDPDIFFSEIYGGGPIVIYSENPKLFGWVARIQISNLMTPQYSIGMQYNVSDHDFMDNLRKKLKLTMFVQVFPMKNKHTLGNLDIHHYFSISVYRSLYLRGTNRFFFYYGKEKIYVQSFQDLIFPLHRTVDLFIRHNYQNRNDLQFGNKGSEFSAGVRFNISL